MRWVESWCAGWTTGRVHKGSTARGTPSRDAALRRRCSVCVCVSGAARASSVVSPLSMRSSAVTPHSTSRASTSPRTSDWREGREGGRKWE